MGQLYILLIKFVNATESTLSKMVQTLQEGVTVKALGHTERTPQRLTFSRTWTS